ncbi:MAG: SDR family oxidoreductase [Bacteroidetes bacterium]|nr:SDR family oxidoreductase [Bacteroidota bacterium]MCW5895659.1 SDR family oxidoreductase [Bacteroidota bacterium]
MNISLSNKVSLITGGSRGIGAATALMLAEAGSEIILNYARNTERAGAIASAIRELGRKVLVQKANVGNAAEARSLVEAGITSFGKIDIVVNNAGIWTYGEIGAMDEKVWDETMDANLKSIFNICNAVVPHMKRNGGGRIINVASTAGQRGEAFHSHYAASKGGVIAFTKSIAVELAPFNILVNTVAPGWVDTEMTEAALGDEMSRKEIAATIPLNRIATPEDIAGPVLFLASDLARHITGSTISVNGGSVLL